MKLVIGDAYEGIEAATARVLATTWQRGRVHFRRNALAHAGKSGRRGVSAFIATDFAPPDHATARTRWRLVADQMRPKRPKLATLMDTAEEDVLACIGLRPFLPQTVPRTVRRCADRRKLPARHRATLHSTTPIERLNGEIERSTDGVGFGQSLGPMAFPPSLPNEASIQRSVGAIPMEQTEEWTVQRGRYTTLETLAPVRDDVMVSLPAAPRD